MKIKFLIFKSTFILLFVFVIYKNYLYFNVKSNKANSYYATSGEVLAIQKEYINNFSRYLQNEQYNKAFDMLSDECKDLYGNNIENFKSKTMSKYYNKNYAKKELLLEIGNSNIEKNKRKTIIKAISVINNIADYGLMPNTKESSLYYKSYKLEFTVIETAPYDYKLYVEM